MCTLHASASCPGDCANSGATLCTRSDKESYASPLLHAPRGGSSPKSSLRCLCRRRSHRLHLPAAPISSSSVRDLFQEVKAEYTSGEASWMTEHDVRRMLVATEGDEVLARKKMADAVQWKLDTLDPWMALPRSVNVGDHRVIALGYTGRPLCYGCGAHQRREHDLMATWLSAWHQAVEASSDPNCQIDVVLDCSGCQILLNLHVVPSVLKLVWGIDCFFAERIHRFIVLDMPRIADFVWNGVSPFVPPKTRKKLFFVRRDSPASMEHIWDLCKDKAMRDMVTDLFAENEHATPLTGGERSNALTDKFLQQQREQLVPAE